MKVRTGFVSNSSSSSFVVVTTKENHEKALAECHPYVQAVVKKVASHGEFLGRNIVHFGDLQLMGGESYTWGDFYLEWDGETPVDEWGDSLCDYPENALDIYLEKLGERKEDVFQWSMG